MGLSDLLACNLAKRCGRAQPPPEWFHFLKLVVYVIGPHAAHPSTLTYKESMPVFYLTATVTVILKCRSCVVGLATQVNGGRF